MANAGYADAQYTMWCRPTGRRSRTASGFRYPSRARRVRTPAAAASGTRRQLGQQHRAADDQQLGHATPPPQTGLSNTKIFDAAERVQRPPAVREHGRAARGEGPDVVDAGRRGRQDRVGQPDPHGLDGLRPVPAAGGAAPQLLGSAGAAQLRAPGLQRRRAARGHLHAHGERAQRQRRAQHDAAVAIGVAMGRVSSGTRPTIVGRAIRLGVITTREGPWPSSFTAAR